MSETNATYNKNENILQPEPLKQSTHVVSYVSRGSMTNQSPNDC